MPNTLTGAVPPSCGAEGLPWPRVQRSKLRSGLSRADKAPVRFAGASCLRDSRSPNSNWGPCALTYLPVSGSLIQVGRPPERSAQCAKQVPGLKALPPLRPPSPRYKLPLNAHLFFQASVVLSLDVLLSGWGMEGSECFYLLPSFKKINYFYH